VPCDGLKRMPLYFLHVKDASGLLQDPDGQECDDLAAARQEAIEAARDLMAECLRLGQPLGLGREMAIADESGEIISTVSFKAALPPDDHSPQGRW
jgi:hypothetical protein